jgi:hypothetical protein
MMHLILDRKPVIRLDQATSAMKQWFILAHTHVIFLTTVKRPIETAHIVIVYAFK